MDYVEECLDRLEKADVVGIDVETSGLSWHRNFVVGWVFSFGPDDGDTYYLPVRHKGGGNIPGGRTPEREDQFYPSEHIHPIELKIKKIVESRPREWYAHNAKFDMHMVASLGIWLKGKFEDTAVNAALLNENQGRYDLDTCCKKTGVTPKVGEIYSEISKYMAKRHNTTVPDTKGSMKYFWYLPGDGIAAEYAKGDGISMTLLRAAQHDALDEREMRPIWELERRVTRTLFRMERRGVPVDEKVLEKVEARVEKMLKDARLRLTDGLNTRSTPQIKQAFLDAGFTEDQFKRTEKGNFSFPEEWLQDVGGQLGQDIITVRKYSNLINTFINGAIKKNIINGRVHGNFNQTKGDEYGVVTGRLSCSHPNFQQIPKRDKVLAPLLRQVFRIQGFKWWSSDYSQQEYRVFAEYARSQFVLEAYAKDPTTDYHQLVADLLGVERDPSAKRINLGVIYNMGAPSLAKNLSVAVDIARGYLMKMRRMMPEATKFNKTAETVAKRRGYVKTIMGRRRRFPNGEFAHKAGNSIIQGSSADITKQKMVECDEFLMGPDNADDLNIASSDHKSNLILQIHDSLDFLFVEEERESMEEVVAIMERFGEDEPITLSVPMAVDTDDGESWGHATFKNYEDWV